MKRFIGFIAGLVLAFSSVAAEGDYTRTLQPGHSGTWVSPTLNAQGANLTVDGDRAVFTFYTYNPHKRPQFNPGDRLNGANHLWLIGSTDEIVAGRVRFDVFAGLGGKYLSNEDPLDGVSAVGLVTLDVKSCSRIDVELYLIDEDSFNTFTLEPLVQLPGCVNECPAVDFSPGKPGCF
jgi:hypothetical protein